MTSEICLMNRHAVVLAADSASTVTRWIDGKREERYFKGANKLFQLSTYNPVGLMINDSASILRVPWEIPIKEFRSHLGETSFPTVKGYAESFFQFLNQNSHMFPVEIQMEVFVSSANTAALARIFEAVGRNPMGSAEAAESVNAMAAAAQQEAKEAHCHSSLEGVKLDEFIGESATALTERLKKFTELPEPLTIPDDIYQYCHAIATIVVSKPSDYLSTTGLVFAGYGAEDIFPSMSEFQSCGLIASTHIGSEVKTTSITHTVPASVSGFAQTGMIETFQMGISREVYVDVAKSIDSSMDNLRSTLEKALGGTQAIKKAIAKANFDDIFAQASSDTKDEVLERAFSQNAAPLRSVLSSLPIEEMAELAESLISLQSLKEKVTKPSETVGGPVDVAVITKAEGLVWIKRKHYFNGELNSRFAYRQMREHR